MVPGGLLPVGSSDLLTYGSLSVETNGVLQFGFSTDMDRAPYGGLVTADTFSLHEGAGVHLISEVGAMDLDEIYTVLLVEAGTNVLVMSEGAYTNAQGDLSTSDFDLQNYIQLVQSNHLMETTFYFQNSDLYVDLGRISLANSAGFEEGSDLWQIAEFIDQQYGTNVLATTQYNILNGMNGTRQAKQLTRLYETELPHYSHQGIMFLGVDVVGSRTLSFRTARRHERERDVSQPEGSFGQYLESQPWRPWSKGYGSHGSRIDEGDFQAYTHDVIGGMVGVDKGIGNWLFGAAGGFGMSKLKSSSDDISEADAWYGVLYTSLGTERWFANVSASYGVGTADTETGTAFDTTGTFDMDMLAAHISLGREIWVSDEAAVFTPELALRVAQYRQDAHTESSTTAVPREIDSYDHFSVVPTVGITVSWPYEDLKFRCEPRVRAFWSGELNSGEEEVDYTLVGDADPHTMYVRGPVTSVFTFGAGAAFVFDNGWEFAADMNSHFGQLSSLAIALKAGYMF